MEQEKKFSVRLPLDILEHIKQAAKEDERSINSEIIWLLREALKGRDRHVTDHKDKA